MAKLDQVISKTISPDSVQQKTYPCPWPSYLSVLAKRTVLMELKIPRISHTSDNGTNSTHVIMTQEQVLRCGIYRITLTYLNSIPRHPTILACFQTDIIQAVYIYC